MSSRYLKWAAREWAFFTIQTSVDGCNTFPQNVRSDRNITVDCYKCLNAVKCIDNEYSQTSRDFCDRYRRHQRSEPLDSLKNLALCDFNFVDSLRNIDLNALCSGAETWSRGWKTEFFHSPQITKSGERSSKLWTIQLIEFMWTNNNETACFIITGPQKF
jgi:hypothetical protein